MLVLKLAQFSKKKTAQRFGLLSSLFGVLLTFWDRDQFAVFMSITRITS